MTPPEDSGWHAPVLLLAMGALGVALAVSQWTATTLGFGLTTISLLLLVVVVLDRIPAHAARALERATTVIGGGVLIVFFVLLLTQSKQGVLPYGPKLGLVAVAGALTALGFSERGAKSRMRLMALVAVFIVLSGWRIAITPHPPIDVWLWHKEALDTLFAGRNPYGITMPNIYGQSNYYAPELILGDRILAGYQYPPLSLFLAIPGYLVGDYRYSLLGASALTGVALALVRPGRLGAMVAALWLFSQASFFVIQFGYTETFVAMLLVFTVVAASHQSRWTFIPLGLFFASKQYTIVALPLILLMPLPGVQQSFRHRLRLTLEAIAVAIGVSLPFVIWNPAALYHDLVTVQVVAPFRPESLSLPGWWFTTATAGGYLPAWLGFATIIPTTVAAAWNRRPSAERFATAIALVMMGFFFCSKMAFVNYYVLVFGALAVAVAVTPRGRTAG